MLQALGTLSKTHIAGALLATLGAFLSLKAYGPSS
jgi:hypothetical protein